MRATRQRRTSRCSEPRGGRASARRGDGCEPVGPLRASTGGAVVVRPRFDAYVAASERLHEIFSSVTDLIEPLSLDEAFLDVTGSRALFGEPEAIARTLRQRIRDELHLPASAGVAHARWPVPAAPPDPLDPDCPAVPAWPAAPL